MTDTITNIADQSSNAPVDLLVPVVGAAKYDLEQFNEVSKAGDYLRRLQLFGGNSDAVKRERIGPGVYGLVIDAENIEPLGKIVDVVVVRFRPKAMRITEDKSVYSYFDVNNPEFRKVQSESALQDSGCMYGPEFLLYFPPKDEFVTYYMGSKTARKESAKLFQQMNKAATLKSKLIEVGRFVWHGPVVTPCTTPPVRLPDPESMALQVEKFETTVDSTVEKSDVAADGGRER